MKTVIKILLMELVCTRKDYFPLLLQERGISVVTTADPILVILPNEATMATRFTLLC